MKLTLVLIFFVFNSINSIQLGNLTCESMFNIKNIDEKNGLYYLADNIISSSINIQEFIGIKNPIKYEYEQKEDKINIESAQYNYQNKSSFMIVIYTTEQHKVCTLESKETLWVWKKYDTSNRILREFPIKGSENLPNAYIDNIFYYKNFQDSNRTRTFYINSIIKQESGKTVIHDGRLGFYLTFEINSKLVNECKKDDKCKDLADDMSSNILEYYKITCTNDLSSKPFLIYNSDFGYQLINLILSKNNFEDYVLNYIKLEYQSSFNQNSLENYIIAFCVFKIFKENISHLNNQFNDRVYHIDEKSGKYVQVLNNNNDYMINSQLFRGTRNKFTPDANKIYVIERFYSTTVDLNIAAQFSFKKYNDEVYSIAASETCPIKSICIFCRIKSYINGEDEKEMLIQDKSLFKYIKTEYKSIKGSNYKLHYFESYCNEYNVRELTILK